MPNQSLKVGDRVSGKNLNGKSIAGKIVIIPRIDPSIAHVKVDDPAAIGSNVTFAKLSDLSASAGESKPQPAAVKP